MDERTLAEKVYDTALRSERRTIGHRMSRKVLVVAPDHRRAQDWAHSHGIAFSDTIFVEPHNWHDKIQGMRGVEHVILGWAYFTEDARWEIKELLKLIESPPFEGEAVDELSAAADLRS